MLSLAVSLVIAVLLVALWAFDWSVVLPASLRWPISRFARRRGWLRLAFTLTPISGAGVSSFVPEIWSAALLTSLKKAQVFARLCNRNYEGEIAQAGDTVHITSISRPTISSYVANVTVITPEVLTSADRTLVIDQAKYFAFEVDDVDLRQVRGNIIDEAMREAAYGLSDVADQFLAQLACTVNTDNSLVQAANAIAQITVNTGDIAYTQLAKLGQKLDEANVARLGRWVVIPPWYLALLLDTNKIAFNPNVAGGAVTGPALIEGYVNHILGFDIYVSNNAPISGAATRNFVIAGTSDAWSYAEQISKTEAYRPQSSFADAIKGLHLYGGKLVRPDGLATLNASTV